MGPVRTKIVFPWVQKMSDAGEINRRYAEAKRRSQKRTGCILALAGLIGMLVTGAVFVVFLVNGVVSLGLLLFVVVCLVTFVTGLIGWRRGGITVDTIADNIEGPF
jgi:hypothetical protein